LFSPICRFCRSGDVIGSVRSSPDRSFDIRIRD
jgi:hypothetical protein